MSDPERLLSGKAGKAGNASASAAERLLLRSGRDVGPPPDAAAQVWGALVAQLPNAPGLPVTAPSPVTGLGAKLAAVASKVIATAVVAASLATGTTHEAPRAAAAPREPATLARPALSLPPLTFEGSVPAQPAPAPAPAIVDPPASSTNTPSPVLAKTAASVGASGASVTTVTAATTATTPSVSTPASRLEEEGRLVRDARVALRANDPAEALRLLRLVDARIGAGVLDEERQLLAIDALSLLGRADEARTRARAFVARYPKSVHASRMSALSGT